MGHVGFISSVTQAFCGDCNRMRLSTDGKLYTCLFATQGHDLRTLLRAPEPMADEALAARVAALWQGREDRYSQLRGQLQAQVPAAPSTPHTGAPRRIEMSYIGG
jgi:cyclic pyranopterin phosphate synthase